MNLAIFNEAYYLEKNPDVALEVRGQAYFSRTADSSELRIKSPTTLPSGLFHFQNYGLTEGRTEVSLFYDERTYLDQNSDVAQAVWDGTFASGLHHFLEHGWAEGRSNTTSRFNEAAYLARYGDVAAAVDAGIFSSGFQHFILHGLAEGYDPGGFQETAGFNEDFYLLNHLDVAAAVAEGIFSSGFEHYLAFGWEENRDIRITGIKNPLAAITGSSAITECLYGPYRTHTIDVEDALLGFTDFTPILKRFSPIVVTGVVLDFWKDSNGNIVKAAVTDGSCDGDIIYGTDTNQQEIFLLGMENPDGLSSTEFYTGVGSATIYNFGGQDRIVLGGGLDGLYQEVTAEGVRLYRNRPTGSVPIGFGAAERMSLIGVVNSSCQELSVISSNPVSGEVVLGIAQT